MKKFDELRRLAEKHLDYDYDVETLKQYCELEPQEIEYINMTNPATILALLADREQLRECLRVIAIAHEFERGSCMKANVAEKARWALMKSDGVENV